MTIHPTAEVDATAHLADGCEIGPFAVVGPRSHLGPDCVLRSHAVVGSDTTLGHRCTVHPFAVVGGDPQDLKWKGEQVSLECGDDNSFREHSSVHRGTVQGGGLTTLGNRNLIMAGSHVGHDCHIGSLCIIANNVMLGGHVVVGDRANLGGGAGIHHFTTIGSGAFLAGLARVIKDVPPWMMVDGAPAEVRGCNRVGMQRAQMTEEDIHAVLESYRMLYREPSGDQESTCAVLLEQFSASETIQSIVDSIRATLSGKNGRALENQRSHDKTVDPRDR